ncbi:MAG: DUF1236 domain-containing protein [Xanthobacteraceae bacterium]|jgi:hypothetical protein
MISRSLISAFVAAALFGCAGGSGASAQTTTPSGPADAASDTGLGGAIQQKLILSPAQRTAIYDQVSKDKTKAAPKNFSPVIGGDVPPMIELYALPDDAVAGVPAAKLYKYTMVENKVVLVDPTKMRVIDVIGPPPSH